jgi:methylmalonyl-CoA mutase cobalamin-binding subunit
VVASELGRGDPIEARTRVLAKRLNDLDVTADGRGGVVATDELVAQALQAAWSQTL